LKHLFGSVFAIAVMMGWSAAYAVQPDEIMSDPVKESRARDLSRELRCMVCHVWTAPGWQEKSSRRRLGRCCHVFGL
jgi:hypothetical protein